MVADRRSYTPGTHVDPIVPTAADVAGYIHAMTQELAAMAIDIGAGDLAASLGRAREEAENTLTALAQSDDDVGARRA